MGSCCIGSGMTDVDAGSGWDDVASGRGVEVEGPPIGGTPGVDAGGEDSSGRASSETGSGRCSDGPASYPRLPCWKTNQISFSRFSTRSLKSTNIRRTFWADTTSGFFMHSLKTWPLVTTSPRNPKESKNFRETPCHLVLSASNWIRPSSAAAARAFARPFASSNLRFRSATWV